MKNKVFLIFILTLLVFGCVIPVTGINNQNKQINQNVIGNNPPQINWWYDLDAPSFGSAAIDDFDGDGKPEIVFGTYFNDEHIYALNAEDGTLLWKYNTGGCNDASPAIADVDLDGDLEVIIPTSSPYKVYCFDGESGDVEWSTSTGYPNCIDSPPAIADVDNDNKPEVILGTFYGYVFCLDGEDGGVNWQVNLGTDSYIQSGPNILDLDSDGQLDIVVSQYAGDCRVYALKGDDGSTLWYSDLPQDYMYHGGSFADIDEDGKPEIAIGCYDNHVYVFNGEDGSLLWDYTAPYYIASPTSIADLNNDGHLEIVFTSYNILGVLSHTGSLLWSYPTGGSIFRGASIADIDGDGTLDVCFGSDDGKLRVLRGDDGQVVWTYDLEAHYGDTFNIDHAPTICDFDSDGKLDIFVVGGYGTSSPSTDNHGRAYALSAGDGTGPGWPMFRYDLVHSACFDSNNAPFAPLISGPDFGLLGDDIDFTFVSTDSEGDDIYYYIDWDDGNNEEWIGPYVSGEEVTVSHTWTSPNNYEIKAKAKDISGDESDWSEPFIITIVENSPPDEPTIDGPNNGKPGVEYTYCIIASDPDEDSLYVRWDWDDGTGSDWLGPLQSGTEVCDSHIWNIKGTYTISVTVEDEHGEIVTAYKDVIIPKNKFIINSLFLKIAEDIPLLGRLLSVSLNFRY